MKDNYSDINAYGYSYDENLSMDWSDGNFYLNLEYCDKELKGRERFLKALSAYIKSDIYSHEKEFIQD
ncbi:MAG: hypothetical protein ACI4E1_14155 [Lachnospira sp.]